MTNAVILPAGGCSVQGTLDALGPASAFLVLRDAAEGTRRFDGFVANTGLNEATVASRLKHLVRLGILVKSPYTEPGKRARDEYLLTELGRELMPVVVALMQWGDQHRPDDGPIRAVDRTTHEPVAVRYVTDSGRIVSQQDVDLIANAPADRGRLQFPQAG